MLSYLSPKLIECEIECEIILVPWHYLTEKSEVDRSDVMKLQVKIGESIIRTAWKLYMKEKFYITENDILTIYTVIDNRMTA